jgi:uncharacterized membrane protein YbhN (UPF0104 family)
MKKQVKIVVAVAITIGLLFILAQSITLQALKEAFQSFSPTILAIAFIAYLIANYFRAARFQGMLEKHISTKNLFGIVCLHNLFAQLLPARTGEVSFLVMIKKKGIAIENNIATLGMARILDAFVVAAILVVGILALPTKENTLLTTSVALLILLALGLLTLYARPTWITKIIELILPNKPAWLQTIKTKIIGTIHALSKILHNKGKIKLTINTLGIWLFMYISTIALLKAVIPEITLLGTLLVASLPVIVSALPIHGVAGYGSTEVAYLLPLVLLGISSETAIAAGFAIHTIELIFMLVAAPLGPLFNR